MFHPLFRSFLKHDKLILMPPWAALRRCLVHAVWSDSSMTCTCQWQSQLLLMQRQSRRKLLLIKAFCFVLLLFCFCLLSPKNLVLFLLFRMVLVDQNCRHWWWCEAEQAKPWHLHQGSWENGENRPPWNSIFYSHHFLLLNFWSWQKTSPHHIYITF